MSQSPLLMCSSSCISARRSSASSHSRASSGRTITGRVMPKVIGPGTASCSSSSTGLWTPRSVARRVISSRRHATGRPVRRIIDSRQNTDEHGDQKDDDAGHPYRSQRAGNRERAARRFAVAPSRQRPRRRAAAGAVLVSATDGTLAVTGTSMVIDGAPASQHRQRDQRGKGAGDHEVAHRGARGARQARHRERRRSG